MKPVRTILLRLLASLGAMLVPCIATAQDFPSRTIRIIVPSSPGPSLDIIARLTGQELAKVLGQNVIVENKPGANQQIGYDFVANSAPADGYTIAMVNAPGMATLPTTAKGLRFDPVKDFVPLLALGETRVTWAISSTYPWKTFAELVAYARANWPR